MQTSEGPRWNVVGRILHSGKRERELKKERGVFLCVCVCFAFENTRQDVSCASPSASDQVHVDS